MNASSGGKSSELRHLRYELKRLKTYLAVLEYDLGLPEQKTEGTYSITLYHSEDSEPPSLPYAASHSY